MLGDIFLVVWLIIMAAYFIAIKFRYDEVVHQYVKVRIKFRERLIDVDKTE